MKVQTVTLTRDKDCQGSVRFSAPKPQPGETPPPTNSVYVNRLAMDVAKARVVEVTVKVIG